ncbi:alanine acetyltransferase [Sulfolobus acidocaldarius SUSAZ]|nr:alanine acetyltransferase [Sulfolobus acidocaldarius SUSAZ]
MIIISDAREEDLPEIYDVELESFDNPYPFSLLRAYYYISGDLFIVAKSGNKVIGYILGIIQFGYRGHIVSIAVKKDKRGSGIGTKLISELENRFKLAYHCIHSYLEVYYKNMSAINFYIKNGYKAIRIQKDYYGREKHAIIMIKSLYDHQNGFE